MFYLFLVIRNLLQIITSNNFDESCRIAHRLVACCVAAITTIGIVSFLLYHRHELNMLYLIATQNATDIPNYDIEHARLIRLLFNVLLNYPHFIASSMATVLFVYALHVYADLVQDVQFSVQSFGEFLWVEFYNF